MISGPQNLSHEPVLLDPLDGWIDRFKTPPPRESDTHIASHSSSVERLLPLEVPRPHATLGISTIPNAPFSEPRLFPRSPPSLPSMRLFPLPEQTQRPSSSYPGSGNAFAIQRRDTHTEVSPRTKLKRSNTYSPQWQYTPPHLHPSSQSMPPPHSPTFHATPNTPVPNDFPAPPPESVCEISKLRAQLESVERQNRLLEAALQAVLWTAGSLNRCPCGSVGMLAVGMDQENRSASGSGSEEGARRPSATSVASGGSALEVYKETRL
jgi:hypothetical protein